MSKVQTLRGFINQRLSAAAEEIFELFERTIAEYEEQLCRSKEDQHRLMDAVFNPEVRLHRADMQKLMQKRSSPETTHIKEELFTEQEVEQLQGLDQGDIIKFTFNPVHVKTDEDRDEDVHQLMERGSSLDQEVDPPEPPHVKEEEEGEQLQVPEEADIMLNPVKTNEAEEDKPHPSLLHHQTAGVQQPLASKEEQQEQNPVLDQEDKPEPLHIKEEWEPLQGLEEADMKPVFIPVPMKIYKDDDEEKPQPLQLHLNQTEENTDTDGGSEDCGGSEETSFEFDTDDSVTWEETDEPQAGSQQNKGASDSQMEYDTAEASVNDSERAKHPKGKKKKSDRVYECKVCGKTYQQKRFYKRHYTRFHLLRPKNFPCSHCKRKFKCKSGLVHHMREHTGERPYKCSQCEKAFKRLGALKVHITYHTGEKPFTCTVCQKGFRSQLLMAQHKQTHTGEGPTCSLCQIAFRTKKKYYKHMKIHAREKPFSCSRCEKSFLSKETLKRHMTIHKKERSFSCAVCKKSYTASYLKNHKCKGEKVKPDRVRCGACNRNFTASYHRYHRCKAKEGKTNEAAEDGLNSSEQQGSADHSQEVSDQHEIPSGQHSSDQQHMLQPSIIQASPVIMSVGPHFNLLTIQSNTDPQTSSFNTQ